jgi:Zn-dependent protease
MAFADRDYQREGEPGGQGFGSPGLHRILRWLNASFPIGTYLDIRVRVHITFFLLVIVELIRQGEPLLTLRWTGLLFLSVLVHEFGHCLACRRVGGSANEILMWPLGGLAYCRPPRTPYAEFVTVAWGPLVNLLIAAACFAGLWFMWGSAEALPVSLNPFSPWGTAGPVLGASGLIQDLFVVNYSLLWFNLALVFYPFDAGRLIQVAIWWRTDEITGLRWACRIGMVGSIVTGLVAVGTGSLLLLFIAFYGFTVCYQQGQALRQGAVMDASGRLIETEGEEWWKRGREDGAAEPREGWLARWRRRRRIRLHRDAILRRQALEVELDRVLAKIKALGRNSLTMGERRVLHRATKEKRRGEPVR